MAYAALRNALGDREYIPACLGRTWTILQSQPNVLALAVANEDGLRFQFSEETDDDCFFLWVFSPLFHKNALVSSDIQETRVFS